MSETTPQNQFQELFLGLDYFKRNRAVEEIKKRCNVSEQSWNNWWSGRKTPKATSIRIIVDIISEIKHSDDPSTDIH